MPPHSWDSRPLAHWLDPTAPSDPAAYLACRKQQQHRFFWDRTDHIPSGVGDPAQLTAEAEAILAGAWRYFGRRPFPVGFPPDWHRNPLSGELAPAARHWSQIGDFDHGDIKLIWEASRFSVAYTLVRAYALTGDERYPGAFWALVLDWAEKNPPQRGPNWKCGQEAALRALAWCFGLFGFSASPASTCDRVAFLAAMLAAHAERIERTISFARLQKNNHAVSEALGLWTVGLLFPEFRRAHHWRTLGKTILEEEIRRQIYPDGSYILFSTNYHRMVLQLLIWALRLGEINNDRFSDEAYVRFEKALLFLHQLTDPETGRTPNCGGNDGTLVLALNSCAFSDFRPVLQAGYYLLHRKCLFPLGSWDEDLFWLFGVEALQRSPSKSTGAAPKQEQKSCSHPDEPEIELRQSSLSAQSGGYYTLRSRHSWALARCSHYQDRPHQADQLHLDLWWHGVNVACDAGSYLYNGELPWNNSLARTVVHNTVTVDGCDQMARASRFLWLDWAQGSIRWQMSSSRGLLEFWEGEHTGYRRLGVTHRRAVLRAGEDSWLVVDDILGTGDHTTRLHWLLPDLPYEFKEGQRQLVLRTPSSSLTVRLWCNQPSTPQIVRAGQQIHGVPPSPNLNGGNNAILGWRSLSYADKEAALSLVLETGASMPVRFITLFHPSSSVVSQLGLGKAAVQRNGSSLEVQLGPLASSPLVHRAALSGAEGSEPFHLVEEGLSPAGRNKTHTLLIHQAFAMPSEAGGTRHYELACRTARRGHRFTVVASNLSYLTGMPVREGARRVRMEFLNGVQVLRAYAIPTLHRSYLWRALSFLGFGATSLLAALRVKQVELVMGTTPPIVQAATAWLVAKLRRKPFILEVRDLWPQFAIDVGVLTNPLLIWLSRWLERFLYAHATHLIVNSPAYREYLTGKGVPDDKISLIPNGVDPEVFDPSDQGIAVRQRFGLEGKFIVTYAGAMGLANALEAVVRAAGRLSNDPKIHFMLVGDGKERANLENLARSLRLTNITFAGPQPKSVMASFLAASDACLATLKDIPMFRTTYPNKVFDYMAAGRPTILAIDGVIREVIESAQGGLFVPPEDDVALAEAIQTLNENRERAKAMGTAARAYVVEHFHREKQAQQFASLASQIVHPDSIVSGKEGSR